MARGTRWTWWTKGSRAWLVLICVAFAVAGGIGALAAGGFGAVALAILVWAVLLVAVRAGLPDRTLPVSKPARDERVVGFPTFRMVRSQLWSATRSKRLYDHALRPRLARQADLLLWARAGIDAASSPDRARALLGPDAWALIDTRTPPSYDDTTPGPSLEELTDLARRLEEL